MRAWKTTISALAAAALTVVSTLALADPPPAAADAVRAAPPTGWVRTGNEDGVISYKRELPSSPIVALRGEGVVNAPIARVVSVLFDYKRAPEWVDSLEEARLVRMLSEREFIEYDHVGTPPLIMKDRDFVCRGHVYIDTRDPQSFTMTLEPASDPRVPRVSKYVRGELRGYWKFTSQPGGKQTYVIAEFHGDPKGGVPKWLVNLFQKSWAHDTIQALREQVKKRDLKVLPSVVALFEGKPLGLAQSVK
jgi:hypothetical protein